ncbi:MAG: hypothetical protein P8M68_01945 [Aquiluna sp.]|nr:hypothetical protein [Aquiluna sp.]
MSKLGWFVVGAAIGAVGVIQMRDNPKAQQAVEDIKLAAKDFSSALTAGYQEREAEIHKASKTNK